MASLALYARRFPPDRFATLVGLQVGLGTIGTLIATAPLAFSTAAIGWRGSFLLVAAFTVPGRRRPGRSWSGMMAERRRTRPRETLRESLAGILAVMRTPSVGRLFLHEHRAAYSSFAIIVGLWGGPYLTHIYGYELEERGSLLLIPVVAQIIGSLVWGPMDRIVRQLQAAGGCSAPSPPRPRLGYLALVGTLSPARAGRLVRGVRLPVRLCAGADRARPVAVPARSGRARADAFSTSASMGGVFLVQIVSGFVIDLFPTGPGRRLRARRLPPGVRPAGGLYLIGTLAYLGVREPSREPTVEGSPAPIA